MDIDVEDIKGAMVVTWETPTEPCPKATFIVRADEGETYNEPEEATGTSR